MGGGYKYGFVDPVQFLFQIILSSSSFPLLASCEIKLNLSCALLPLSLDWPALLPVPTSQLVGWLLLLGCFDYNVRGPGGLTLNQVVSIARWSAAAQGRPFLLDSPDSWVTPRSNPRSGCAYWASPFQCHFLLSPCSHLAYPASGRCCV